MGTYTSNYNLFLPSIGEQGWGDLVNGNFVTIDTTIKGLSDNIGTLETEIDAVEERVTVLETGNFETITVNDIRVNGELTQNVRTITVTPHSSYWITLNSSLHYLDYIANVVYTGTFIISNGVQNSTVTVYYYNLDGTITTDSITISYTANNKTFTIPNNTIRVYISGRGTNTGGHSVSLPVFSE